MVLNKSPVCIRQSPLLIAMPATIVNTCSMVRTFTTYCSAAKDVVEQLIVGRIAFCSS